MYCQSGVAYAVPLENHCAFEMLNVIVFQNQVTYYYFVVSLYSIIATLEYKINVINFIELVKILFGVVDRQPGFKNILTELHFRNGNLYAYNRCCLVF